MNALAPGLRELGRMGVRLVRRLRLWWGRRELARRETALGLLGWQQADYDAPTEAHVRQLMDCEREQARLNNESAEWGLKIHALEEQRATRQRGHEEAVAEALQREMPAAKNGKQLEAEIAAMRKEGREIEARLRVVDGELLKDEERYRALVAREGDPGEVEAELLSLRRRILALPRENAEWQGKLALTHQRVQTAEELARRVREAQEIFEKDDAALGAEIADGQRAKRRLEKQIDGLEKAKGDPYREIGRVLATAGIAPLNQPQALRLVLEQRRRVAAEEAALATSLEASTAEDRGAVRNFWMLAAVVVALALVAILAFAAQSSDAAPP